MSPAALALAFAGLGALLLVAYCRLLSRLLPRQHVPQHWQLLAWLGILATFGAACFAVAFFLGGR